VAQYYMQLNELNPPREPYKFTLYHLKLTQFHEKKMFMQFN